MVIRILLAFSLLILASCGSRTDLVNTRHLEHLYEEKTLDGTTMGCIWIYCEAPDYHLVADEDEGFTCVDDVARALVFYCRDYAARPDPSTLRKIRSLAEFVLFMQADNGYFYNFMFQNGDINTTHQNSVPVPAFWAWRALWALSELNLLEKAELAELQNRSRRAMEKLIKNARSLCVNESEYAEFEDVKVPACLAELGADQAGVMLLALSNHYRKYPSEPVKELMLRLGTLLLETQYGDADTPPHFAFFSWRNYWHAWGNSQAYALLRAGRLLDHPAFVEAALNEVRHFYPYVLKEGFLHEMKASQREDGAFDLSISKFPQIAYNIRPMTLATLEAYDLSGEQAFLQTALQMADWLRGNNPAQLPMYDPLTGRCFDGISSASEVNRNSGAESTIEALLVLQALRPYRK